MIQRIIAGEMPFSRQSLAVLKDIMFIKETEKGRLYGKTWVEHERGRKIRIG